MRWTLEVVVPVSDVDRANASYADPDGNGSAVQQMAGCDGPQREAAATSEAER